MKARLWILLALAISGCSDSPAPVDSGGPGPVDAVVRDGEAPPPIDSSVPPVDAFVPPSGDCAALPAPTGTVVNVTEAQASALPGMVRDAAEGTTFVLAAGTYRMTGDEASRRIQIRARGITIRGATGNPSDVVIDGEYATNEIVGVYSPDATLAELTITHAVDHGVHVTPPDGGPDVTGFHMYRVHMIDHGEQFLKVNPPGARDAWTDDGLVECSTFRMTDAGRPHVERAVGGCYTGGIDAHASRGWIVRQNDFEGIYCAGEGLAEHAIHFWVGSRDTLVERNRIIDCARGIGFGLVEDGATRMYPDDPHPGLFVGHYDGIIRNNVIVARIAFYDTGVELDQARGSRVLHNTVIETAGATATFSSIDARFANTQVTIRNNLVRRITNRGAGTVTADHNVEMVDLASFVDAAGADWHLSAGATTAIDQGVVETDAGLDLDGDPHGAMPDIGADER